MFLFIAAGMAAHILWDNFWAPPVGIVLGLLIAPMVPVPKKPED